MSGSLLGVGALVLVGLIVAGAVGSGALGDSNDNPYPDYNDFYDGLPMPDYDIAVNDVADPWSGAEAPDGYRLVAINVTITAGEDSEFPYYASAFDFTLIDNEDFAYQPIEDGEQPMLPYGVDLEPGQKTRGWITFEVDEDNELKALTNYGDVITLDGNGD